MDERIHELIAKDLAGESSPAESAEVQAWIQAAPENQRYVDDLSWLWQQVPQGRADFGFEVDTEKALGSVHAALKAAPALPPKAKVVPMRGWVRAAAAALILGAAAVWFLHPREAGQPLQITAAGTPQQDTLVDGSVVSLNRRSELYVNGDFNHRERRMRLKGEAHFSVQPNVKKPFIVEVGALEVMAVGTAFNVDDFTQQDKIVVTVTEGKVQMQTKTQQLLLVAGEAGEYDKEHKVLRRLEKTNPNVLAYRDLVFHFPHNTTMREIVNQLNSVYETQVAIKSPGLQDCQINDIVFQHKTLEQILETLREIFNFTYRKEGNTYVLEGSCDY